MNVLYKVSSHEIHKFNKGVDYVEKADKILFTNGKEVYKNQLDKLLVNKKEGPIFFTYNKNMFHKYQKRIKKIKGE